MPSIRPVILCGGAGTRLWPLSRRGHPKQFVPLLEDKSLFRMTLERVAALKGDPPLIVAGADYRFMVTDDLDRTGLESEILLEPMARNTAAAIALAALQVEEHGATLLLICPADHYIPDKVAFSDTVLSAVPIANTQALVTFGILPTHASTAYGYMQQGTPRPDGGFQVSQFIEKPHASKAQALILSGSAWWNAGIFLCRADAMLAALDHHAPDILASCRAAMQKCKVDTLANGQKFYCPAAEEFATSPNLSIDYAVMEHHPNVAMVPFHGRWSDVGSWNALAELCPADAAGNRISGPGQALHSHNVYIHADKRLVVTLGVEDLLVVDTPDALLVAARKDAEEIKNVVTALGDIPQTRVHRKVERPWGWYDCVDQGDRFLVKRIGVKPGAALSLQKHHHRAEHWVVVRGIAEVTCGERVFTLVKNQSTYIPLGEIHRLQNIGSQWLEVIEVQSGEHLSESDIVRIEDQYNRVP